VKENGREIKRAPARERETVKEINLGLLERLEVSEAAANNTHTHTHSHIHALTHALIVICVLDSFIRRLSTLECAIHRSCTRPCSCTYVCVRVCKYVCVRI